ncbi:MAG: hypothetical protein Q9227_006515 [Pyrenula ochraceoflavens]
MPEDLAAEIEDVRAKIKELTQHRRTLTSAILTSNRIQKRLQLSKATGTNDAQQIIAKAAKDTTTNIHRMTCSVTSFPFQDPSPSEKDSRLLGIRFDICRQDGTYDSPYYILLKRLDGACSVKVYRHTIPAFIPLRTLEEQYLPQSDVENQSTPEQDLHKLVQKVRQDLVSWRLRNEAIQMLKNQLGLHEIHETDEHDSEDSTSRQNTPSLDRHGVVNVKLTSVEAEYVRIQWRDGRIGRIKLSKSGKVERCVVYGENGRVKKAEDLLEGGGGRVEELASRLEMLERQRT